MKYINYTSDDFVKDAYFQKWVLDSDEETNAFWRNWLAEHPFKRPDVEDAIEIIVALEFKSDIAANQAFVEVWNNIKAEQLTVQEHGKMRSIKESVWLAQPQKLAAAIIAVLLVSCSIFFFTRTKEAANKTYATAYGQTATVILPDSSVVTLNANSSIAYAETWNEDEPREVWLNGEGFFSVLKKRSKGNARFKVHTDELTVEVLGTTFNVNSRRSVSTVVLNTGKVKLSLKQDDDEQDMLMKPGELVKYTVPTKEVQKKKVNVEFYSAWKENKLMFNKTTLKNIALKLYDTYGLQVIIADKALENKKFTGMVPADDVDLLLNTLQKLYHLEISRRDKQITLTPSRTVSPAGT